MHNGWIKLHRKILYTPFFADSKKLKLWLICLLRASHTERKVYIDDQKVILRKGQFVTGRKALALMYNEDVKLSERVNEQTLWRWLKVFEKDGMLNIESNTKFTVITVLNWSQYQTSEQADEQPEFNEQTINDERVNTYKNLKNYKNLENANKKSNSQKSSTSDVDLENAHLLYELINENEYLPEPNFNRWADHFRILRNNGYNTDDDTIKYLIEYSQENSYWQEIIRSSEDFKVHYPRLYMCT